MIISQILTNYTQTMGQTLLEMHVLDIGQGDSILFITNDKKYILIDGGPSSDLIEKLSDELPFWQNKIEVIVATHGDSDHITGLVEVFRRYSVDTFLYNGEERNTIVYNELIQTVINSKTNILKATDIEQIQIGCCTIINIMWPNKDTNSTLDTNDKSVSIILSYFDFDVFLAGDLGYKYEEKIVSNIDDEIEIMKLSHHGSKTSTSKKVLEFLSPEVAVISAGKDNKFGHPHEEVLNLLKDGNIDYLRTDENGRIGISSDGYDYWIETQK